MSSERRIQASRANGALSKGPVTADGKRRSSANSLRHGLLAGTVVLEGEREADFLALCQSLERELQPRDSTERAMVENIAVSRWRQMRVWAIEKTTLMDAIAKLPESESGDPASLTGCGFKSLAEESPVLELIGRYEARYDRQHFRCLRYLRRKESEKYQTNLTPRD